MISATRQPGAASVRLDSRMRVEVVNQNFPTPRSRPLPTLANTNDAAIIPIRVVSPKLRKGASLCLFTH